MTRTSTGRIRTDDADGQGLAPSAIAARYVVFAGLAGAANLGTQAMVSRLTPDLPLLVSIVAGTGVGFVVKYVLDKRWIFYDRYESRARESRKIAIYGVSGLAMTLLFWACELGAWALWPQEAARYFGGALGLAMGYWIKYRLDKRFVFARAPR